MQCQLSNTITQKIKKLFSNIKNEISLVSCHCSEEGIVFNGMNDSLTSLVRIRLSKDACVEYVAEEDMATVGLRLDLFSTILKCADVLDSMKWAITEDECIIQLGGVKSFRFPLIDLEQDELHIPDVEKNMSLKTENVSRLMKHLGNLNAESISLTTMDECIEIEVKGDSMKALFELDCHGAKDGEQSTVSYKMFKWLFQFGTLQSTCMLSMGDGMPLGIHVSEQDKIFVDAFLAPMVD